MYVIKATLPKGMSAYLNEKGKLRQQDEAYQWSKLWMAEAMLRLWVGHHVNSTLEIVPV